MDALITALPEKIDALFVCQGISQGVNPDLKVMKVNFLSVKYLVEALAPRSSTASAERPAGLPFFAA